MAKRDYCFELKSKLSELNALCRHLEDCGDVMELPQKCLFEINLGLDELFTNIISYGFDDGIEHQIKFSLAKEKETLVVQVEDDGKPFNPLEAADPEVSQDLDTINIGGLGIHLVKKMMDDIDYQRVKGKNKLILKKCVAAHTA
jgi:serine/threonine-protein kinase RsbW